MKCNNIQVHGGRPFHKAFSFLTYIESNRKANQDMQAKNEPCFFNVTEELQQLEK